MTRGEYRDPLDVIWLKTAERLGFRVQRSDAVFAAYDGEGTLTLSTPEHFDADDSLAQLILHEICHMMIEDCRDKPDWGLVNTDERHLPNEHAAIRLQAKLTEAHGLRGLLAVTTDHRPYYDALPEDPFEGDDDSCTLAKAGYARARGAGALTEALSATKLIAQATRQFATTGSSWA